MTIVWRTRETRSEDGTRIVFHTAGRGRPLVVVHGGFSTAEHQRPVAACLSEQFEVALVERRNYGVSGATGSPHTFAQDGQDIGAVLQAFDGPCFLYGHSAGALSALHAARDFAPQVERLALYEPPLSACSPQVWPVVRRIAELMEAGEAHEAMILGFVQIVGLSEPGARQRLALRGDQVAPLAWPAYHDLEGVAALSADGSSWASLPMATLLLRGSDSVEHPLRDSIDILQGALPLSRVQELPGQEHIAHLVAPRLLADALSAFFAKAT